MTVKRDGYLPTLDGWRAIAVFFVIFYHDSLHKLGMFSTGWIQEHGVLGVDIFFGISGLLICSRLMEEEQAHGQINLKQFYVRRFFRILPPMFLYLLVVAILGFLQIIPVLPKEWFASLFFFRNYTRLSTVPGHMDWYTAHFWSLAVEEHFYFILPGVLVFVPKRWRLTTLGMIVAIVAIWRIYRQQTRPYVFLMHHTDTRLDALLWPAILAILLVNPHGKNLIQKISRFWFIPGALLVYLLTFGKFPVFTPFAQSILIPLMLLGTVLHPGGWFAQILESPPLRWIGKISYSLYLWQGLLFLGRFYPWFRPLGWLQDFPVQWATLFACATASYYLLEKPMMRWGHRLAPPATPGRPELA